ncbi:DUF4783 domain-containing protein [Peijinzhouia sedimentorum]|tara:strand:- start:181 stop:591 length:411 start_codon:yes stop_codon:yes gene_type:complete
MHLHNRSLVYLTSFLLISFLFTQNAIGQNAVLTQAGNLIKSGNSKELVKMLHDRVDITIDKDQQTFSSAQAEFVLKDFFQKNPPISFQIIHEGGPKDGLQYVIGKYASTNGNFRVLVRVRKVNDIYKIYNLDFSRE